MYILAHEYWLVSVAALDQGFSIFLKDSQCFMDSVNMPLWHLKKLNAIYVCIQKKPWQWQTINSKTASMIKRKVWSFYTTWLTTL